MQSPASFCYILNIFLRVSDPIYPHRISSREVTQILENSKIPYKISYLPGTLKADKFFLPGNKKLLHDLISFSLFSEAKNLGAKNLNFLENMPKLLSYKTVDGLKLNLSVATITITK